MVKQKRTQQRISSLRAFIITQPAKFTGIFFGVGMFMVFSAGSVIASKSSDGIVLALAVNAVLWWTAGVIFASSMGKRQHNLEQQAGLDLSNQDRIDLFMWTKYGIKPAAKHLQPVLPRYVDYIENNARGKNLGTSRERKPGVIIFSFMFVLQLLIIIGDGKLTIGNVLSLIFFGLLLFIYSTGKPGQSNKMMELLGSRTLRKTARMRQQLK